MAKTVTLRIEDDVYDLFRKAADGEHRSISNFIEIATLAYLSSEAYISDDEMEEINKNKNLIKGINAGLDNIKQGKFRVVN